MPCDEVDSLSLQNLTISDSDKSEAVKRAIECTDAAGNGTGIGGASSSTEPGFASPTQMEKIFAMVSLHIYIVISR